jgi:uncharacterized RDD family membrane protein YckC
VADSPGGGSAADDVTRLASEGGPAASSATLVPGRNFGPFVILRELGRGGMGEVYEAEESSTGRRLALKTFSRSLGDREMRDRLLREGRLAAAISHPNSVYVYGSFEIDGLVAITMELVRGGTIEELVEREGPLPPERAVEFALQLIAGLEAAEACGVLHRDIKPSNCFVDADGIVKIGDYGLSLSIDAVEETRLTTAGTFLGTPAYASPEQVRGLAVDVRSDIYSVGATLYFMLTGRSPLARPNMMQMLAAVLADAPASPAQYAPAVPEALADVVLRCLQKEPAARPATYARLREALLPFSRQAIRPAARAVRFRAGVIDWLVLAPVVIPWAIFGPSSGGGPFVRILVARLLQVAYFAWLEGRSGASLGKRFYGLRVVAADGAPIDVARAAGRAALWSLAFAIPEVIDEAWPGLQLNTTLAAVAVFFVMFATARRTNGYRGLHELASGTRTVSLAPDWHEPQPARSSSGAPALAASGGLIVGGFIVGQRIWEDAGEALDVARDPVLDRAVWIHRRRDDAADLPEARRTIARHTRLRWLASERCTGASWDAFETPAGRPLADLPWSAALVAARDLVLEYDKGLADGTAISPVSLDHLWIADGGSLRVTDFRVRPGVPADSVIVHDRPSAQVFAHTAVVAALGGRLAAVPLPLSTRAAIDTLGTGAYETMADAVDGLAAAAARPHTIPRARRVVGLVLGAVALALSIGAAVAVWRGEAALRRTPELDEAGRMLVHVARFDEPGEVPNLALTSTIPAARYTDAERQAFRLYVGSRYASTLGDQAAVGRFVAIWGGGDDLRRIAARTRDEAASAPPADVQASETGAARVLADIRHEATHPSAAVDLLLRLEVSFGRLLFQLAPLSMLLGVIARGSPILRLVDCGVAGPDGRRASWWRARLRTVLAWLPALAGYVAYSRLSAMDLPAAVAPSVLGLTTAVVVVGFALTMWRPELAPQDRLLRTRIVPL